MRKYIENGYPIATIKDAVEEIKRSHDRRTIFIILGVIITVVFFLSLGVVYLLKKRVKEEENDWYDDFEDEFFNEYEDENEEVKDVEHVPTTEE